MGHNPIAPRGLGITTDQAIYRLARATGAESESLHLQRAREAYAHDLLDLRELERGIEHVLRGGYLDENFVLRAPIMDRVRRRRRQRDCPHDDVYELWTMGRDRAALKVCIYCGSEDAT